MTSYYFTKVTFKVLSFFLVESVLKICPLIDSICIVVHPDQTFATAIIIPDSRNLTQLSEEIGKYGFTVDELCLDDAVKNAFCQRLFTYGISHGLEKFEIPKKITLVTDEWTPESGLVTAAMKLKRKELEKYYSIEIQTMYMSSKFESQGLSIKKCKVNPV